MVDIEKSVIARLKKGNEEFEILVDLDKALDFKSGNASLDEALTTDDIFKDVKKGLHASENEMQSVFKTSDKNKVAEIIIKEGEIQLTAEHKNKLREEKKKKIITLIVRNAVDPKSNIPHPPQRIENAINEVKAKIDEFKPAEKQVQEVIKQIATVLPISYETRQIAIDIPAEFAGQSYSIIKQYSKITRDNWKNDGNLSVVIEVPAGMQNDLFDALNKLTHGHIESKILGKK